ncbi:MAG TPA: metalloregulator ArsR/SmtB family transcription factor [Blastocatellia bacterium]|nr:metalloregulator ArsR/SmtB family transcription factor [Blastocatellia bacterium]
MSFHAVTTNVFHAISDPTRRALIDMLADREQPVNSLCEKFDMTQPAISQHLRVLRVAGLVNERRSGRQRIYKLNPEPLKEVSDWVSRYELFWQNKLTALSKFLEQEQ